MVTGDIEGKTMHVMLPKQVFPRDDMLEGSSSFHIFTPENALFPTEVTPAGTVTEVSELQF